MSHARRVSESRRVSSPTSRYMRSCNAHTYFCVFCLSNGCDMPVVFLKSSIGVTARKDAGVLSRTDASRDSRTRPSMANIQNSDQGRFSSELPNVLFAVAIRPRPRPPEQDRQITRVWLLQILQTSETVQNHRIVEHGLLASFISAEFGRADRRTVWTCHRLIF